MFTKELLVMAGYSAQQVDNLGDLIGVPKERVLDLLHRKTEEALAFAIAENPPEFTKLRTPRRAKRKRPKR